MSEKQQFLTNKEYNDFMQRAFNMFDFDGGHTIDLEVFMMLFDVLGKKVSPTEKNKLDKKMNEEGRSGVSYEEFVERYNRCFPLGKVEEDLIEAFNEAATKEGYLTFESMKAAKDKCKLDFTDDELRALVKHLGNKSGIITLDKVKEIFSTDDVEFELEVPEEFKIVPKNTDLDLQMEE